MSQWTHIVGAIQCSWTEEEAIEKLGKPVLWDDGKALFGTSEWDGYYQNVWCKAFDDSAAGVGIPMGSEGSINWKYVSTDEWYAGAGTLIAIEGDLRDFGGENDINLIINWFTRAAKKARFATLTIKDEWLDEYITVICDLWGTVTVIKHTGENDENN